ncbi:hypothetical protein KC926_02035 [Candidatus Kaiserbacteria bacterium]|nr:hypothetical protein [Candidatus Kaiserbacteria bacterium]
MFANPTSVGISQRVVATLVACAVVLFSIGVYTTAQAANLTDISDTLSDSDVSVVSDHTIAFTVPAGSPGLLATETLTITFPAGFNMGSVAFGDVDFSINAGDQTLAAAPSGATWGAAVAGQVLTITSGTGVLSAGDVVEIQIGTNAAGGSNQITNPTAGSYEIVVTAGAADTGRTRVAIIDNVLVTAIVNTSFDFTITGLATSTAVNGTSTTGSTSPTAIPFGVLTAGEIKSLAQRLNVSTNARNGFVVTVESDGDLQSSTGAIIDNFDDGSDVSDTGTVWNAPGNLIGDETTWGHWGLTSNDSDLNSLGGFYSGEFGANEFVAASTSPRAVFHHDGPSDGTTANIGQSDVLYQVEITALQEAADDYSTTLTYIATPTF